MVDNGIRTSHLKLPNCGGTRHMYDTRHLKSADLKSALHGHFQEKEKTPTTELNIFFLKKVFRQKITIEFL